MNRTVTDAQIDMALNHLLKTVPPEKSISPDDVARTIAGSDGKAWGPLMGRVRTRLLELAREGEIVLLRKGKAVEPDALRGVYRFRKAGTDTNGNVS